MKISSLRLLSWFLAFLSPLLDFLKNRLAMRNSFIRLVSAKETTVEESLSHRIDDVHSEIFGKFKFDRITADFSVTWCYQCPLPFSVRLSETLKFLKLCGRL